MTKTFKSVERASIKRVLAASASTAVLAISCAAFAQDSSDDEIVVTGTKIVGGNITSSSPITTVGQADIELSNTVNAEQFLNQLPQTIPGFDSTSNNPGLGEATVNLRGLGSVRTLVLVNGRRYVSSNQNPGVVDLNTIPAALVEQVDILTGGASATYGSDAMAGVVNFILKDDFEGFDLDTSYEMTEEGDGEIFNTSLTMGGNFAGGRGNAVLSIGYTDRQPVFQGDRVQSNFTLVDGGAAAGFRESGSVNIPSTFVLDFGIDYTDILGINLPCSTEGTTDAGGFCGTDSFGWVFDPNGSAEVVPFINTGPNTNRYNYAPANYLQIPQERYNIYSSATYDINDSVEAYGQFIFVSSQTEQLLAPTPVFTTLTINLDNPFIGATALAALTTISGGTDSDGNGVNDAVVLTGRRSLELGGRLSDVRNDSFQIQGGFRGELSNGYNWNLFGSYGEANSTISQTGNVHVPSYQAAVRENRANIFVPNGLTDDIVSEISVLGTIQGTTTETVLGADLSGAFDGVSTPWADDGMAWVVGAEYRQNTLETFGAGLGADVVGFNQAPAIAGGYDVYELFTEVNWPLIQDKQFVEDLTFTGAYRRSDYSTVGGVDTYAAGLSWTPVDGFRVRGQYQRAVRAPNIGELFAPQTNGFPNIADPCSGGSFGGFGNFDAATQATVTANCVADGVPSGVVGTPFQVNGQIEGLFGGNPDLSEEVADTYTIGFVWEPTFVDGLTLTADYFDFDVSDVIGNVPSQTLFDLCYVQGISSFCSNITRNPTNGTVTIFNSSAQNSAALVVKGWDFSIDYGWDMGEWGTLDVYSLITLSDENSLQSLPTEAPVDCVGFYGATCGEPTPEWNFNTRFDWTIGDWSTRVRWQRISEVKDDLFRNGGTPDLFVPGVDAYDQVDLTTTWSVSDSLDLSFGVENLFDEDYVLIGDDSAEQSNTYPATYDTLGRTYFGRASFRF
ncbi:MAG: TonB-dependent receptor domain-containing protein [Parvularcula sp.]